MTQLEVIKLPSPVQTVNILPGISIDIKRDDLIHPVISGNKWRKLNYHLLKTVADKNNTIITFGGAFSNHLVATAKACQLNSIRSIGIVRGTSIDRSNPTLSQCIEYGMEIIPVSKEEYNERNNYNYHDQWRLSYPFAHIVPEGGGGYPGVMGTMEIVKELEQEYDYILCAVGTATTAAGLILSKPAKTKLLAVNVFKDSNDIAPMIRQQLQLVINDEATLNEYTNDYQVINGFGGAGYAKVSPELKNFVLEFFQKTKIPLDLIYTGKAMMALYHLFEQKAIPANAKVLFYHSGGLQGNKGFNFQF